MRASQLWVALSMIGCAGGDAVPPRQSVVRDSPAAGVTDAPALDGAQSKLSIPSPSSMNVPASILERVASLPDRVFLRRDEAAIADLPMAVVEAGMQGVALGAPERIDRRAGEALWALLVIGQTDSRRERVPSFDNVIVLATDVDRGDVWADTAFPADPSKSPSAPRDRAPVPAPSGAVSAQQPLVPPPLVPPPPEPSSGGAAWVDLERALLLPRRSMRLAVRFIYFDQLSNGALVEQLGEGAPAGPTPISELVNALAPLPPPGSSGARLPAYERGPDTPLAPSQPGLAMAVGRLVEGGASARPVPLHVALQLELSSAMLVEPGTLPAALAKRGAPTAFVRATVLVVRPNLPRPYVVPVRFPVWTGRPGKVGEPVSAAFSIDLAAHLPAAALQPGHQVYVVAGQHVAGPVALGR